MKDVRTVKYMATIEIPNQKKGGLLIPKEPYREDIMLAIHFDVVYNTREHFLLRMEYMYDTMERAIKDRVERLNELSR